MKFLRPFASIAAASAVSFATVGCNVELEANLVNVAGLNPGFEIKTTKDGGRIEGTVGADGEVTIKYKGEEIHHISGLEPGSDFEYEPEDPWAVQVPQGWTVNYAYAQDEATGAIYPLRVYDESEFVTNDDNDWFVQDPGTDLILIGYDLDNTPNGDFEIHVSFHATSPGQEQIKIINAIVLFGQGELALVPVEPMTWDFTTVNSWPYVQNLHVVGTDIEFIDGALHGLPDPSLWAYVKVELDGATPGWDYDQYLSAHPVDDEYNAVYSDWGYGSVGDVDGDGIGDLVTRFDRSYLQSAYGPGPIKLVMEGMLYTPNYNTYQATDWITVGPAKMMTLEVPLADDEIIGGSTLDWTLDVAILGPGSVSFDYWLDITLPDGTPVPWLQLSNVTPGAGFTYYGPYSVAVPRNIPLGTYSFDNRVGDFGTGLTLAADGFQSYNLGN